MDARLNNLEGLAREIKNMSAIILSPTMHDAALVDPDSEHVWPEVQWIVKQGPSPASAAASSSPALELPPLQQQQHATLIVVNTLNVSVAMRLMLDPLRLKKPQFGKAGGSNGERNDWDGVLAPYEVRIVPLLHYNLAMSTL